MQKNLDNKVGMSMPIYMTLLSLYCIGEVDGCTCKSLLDEWVGRV